MPLVPRYSWEQDAQQLVLEVYLPGTALRTTDIYVSDLVVKVNAAPYVLLLDLFEQVDDVSAVVKRVAAASLLRISLQKVKPQVWEQLECQGDKRERRERREESMERRTQREADVWARRMERKHAEEKQTLRAQMAVDDANRQLLSDLKAEEKQREEREMYESFRDMQVKNAASVKGKKKLDAVVDNQKENEAREPAIHPILTQQKKEKQGKTPRKKVSFAPLPEVVESNQEDDSNLGKGEFEVIELNNDGTFDVSAIRQASKPSVETIKSEPKTEESNQSDDHDPANHSMLNVETSTESEDGDDEDDGSPALPPPRLPVQSEIEFTPRMFPTPSRESKAAEEEDWLLKNRRHLASHKGLRRAGDYDISESDPVWLKAKGDDFFRAKDYRSAVNAYSEAIALTSTNNVEQLTACLSNRAACRLQLAQFEDCVSDCSKALSFLPDTREGSEVRDLRTFRLKLKLYVRRGTAHCRLEQFTSAKADYGVALTMDTQNEQLKDDFVQLMALERAHELKLAADESVRAKDPDLVQAIKLYSESLQLHPLSVACLSNRAACYLMLKDGEKCIEDCVHALELLQHGACGADSQIGAGGLAFFSVGPPPGSSKRREWVVRTIVRRGTAFRSTGQLSKAEEDFAAAVELKPANEALKLALKQIRELMQQEERGRDAQKGSASDDRSLE